MKISDLKEYKNEGRDSLLYAMYRTLHDPVIIIKEKRKEEEAFLFLASFNKDNSKIQIVLSVVVSIRSTLVSISTHKKDLQNILNKIKKTDDILYSRSTIGIKPGITG